jgi:hypothetical protein
MTNDVSGRKMTDLSSVYSTPAVAVYTVVSARELVGSRVAVLVAALW